MSDGLKEKTIRSLIWSSVDKIGFQLVAFIVGIITARLLTPKDFGLVGALAVFTILSNALVESGFTSALIHRKKNTDAEYVATFYFNLFLSLLIYGVLFVTAPWVAAYFRMPELCNLSRFLFLSVILNAFGLVQNVVLTKKLSFRILTRVNLLSVILAGIATICLIVFFDFSYWALAWQQVLQVGLRTFFLWIFGSWRISKKADFRVVKELFSFSFFLLITSVITTIVKYIYNIVIGRLYSVEDLGYYSQSYKYQQIPSSILTSALVSVAYPVLAKLNGEKERQMLYFRKLVRLTAFWTFPVLLGLLAISKEFVVILLTDKWLPIVPYFRILLIAALFYPFHVLVLNVLTAKGSPFRNFQLEMIRNGLVVLSLLLCHRTVEQMLWGFLAATILSLLVDMIFVKKDTGYRLFDQVKDVLPYFLLSFCMYIMVLLLGRLPFSLYLNTTLQTLLGALFYFFVLKFFGSTIFMEMRGLFKTK